MKCLDKECEYKELNGGDEISDFYYCKYCGITVEQGQQECLMRNWMTELLGLSNKILGLEVKMLG